MGAFCKPADLLMKLTEGTGPDGTVAQIGQIVIDWVCMHIIRVYVSVFTLYSSSSNITNISM